jgi:uncharacterized protein with PIN domain
MKCHNCNKTLRKVKKPTFYVDHHTTTEGRVRVTYERTHQCPSCDIFVGRMTDSVLIETPNKRRKRT